MKTHQEQQLEFSFPDTLTWEVLDQPGKRRPVGMAFVDLIIDREQDTFLVEIKDPSHTSSPEGERRKYLNRLEGDSLIGDELTPKARDSYTYLHLMLRDDKPIKYIVVLGLDAFDSTVQKGLLVSFKDRLLARIRNECDSPWLREHIADCVVLSVDGWNTVFESWPLRRVSQAA